MRHAQGSPRCHWMPPPGEYLRHTTPVAAMVINVGVPADGLQHLLRVGWRNGEWMDFANKVRREYFVCVSVCCVTSFRNILFFCVLCHIIHSNTFPPIREWVASCQQVASNFYECSHRNSWQITFCDTIPQTINLTDGLTDARINPGWAGWVTYGSSR